MFSFNYILLNTFPDSLTKFRSFRPSTDRQEWLIHTTFISHLVILDNVLHICGLVHTPISTFLSTPSMKVVTFCASPSYIHVTDQVLVEIFHHVSHCSCKGFSPPCQSATPAIQLFYFTCLVEVHQCHMRAFSLNDHFSHVFFSPDTGSILLFRSQDHTFHFTFVLGVLNGS